VSDRSEEVRAFVEAHQPRLLRLAWLLTGDAHRAQDLVQTTLLKAWRSWSQVQGANDPAAYVRQAMVNAHLSASRRRWSAEIPAYVMPDTAVDDRSCVVDDRDQLVRLIRELPPRQRAAIVLRYVEDLDDNAVATVLGCSVQTVRSQISRALASLRIHAEIETTGGLR
jgi:RNA polymerase sigma-70 factor (sigma-E family)